MPVKSPALACVAALLLWAAPATAQPDRPLPQLPPVTVSAAMADAEIARALEAWLTNLNREGRFNGAVLAARDGREIYAGAHGTADIASNAPLNADTRFALASIGKAFTHVAIAQLMQAGHLSSDDTIGELLPDYPTAASRGATVEQLLTHSAGVADIFGPVFRDTPKDQLASNHDYFRLVSQQPPAFAPGAQEQYCNGCYVVLGEIIARISGQSYEDYIAAHVFAPAGMTRSGFFRHDQLPENTARYTGRPQGQNGPLMDVSRFHGVAGSGAGNAYSTLRDMLAFDNALREHRLINPDYTAQVLRGRPEAGRAAARIGFAGGGPGVNTLLYGNGAWTLVVLTNREPPTAEAVGQTVFPLLAGPRPQ
jgi:CubicO group peptidase (beta-lactamase class C family)